MEPPTGFDVLFCKMPGNRHIHPVEEFRRHAEDCQQMARLASDPTMRATWNRMAQRWERCADIAQRHGAPSSSSRLARLKAGHH
jgi:hypothetical protein